MSRQHPHQHYGSPYFNFSEPFEEYRERFSIYETEPVAIGDAAGSPNPPYYSPEMQEYQNANTILRPNLQPTNADPHKWAVPQSPWPPQPLTYANFDSNRYLFSRTPMRQSFASSTGFSDDSESQRPLRARQTRERKTPEQVASLQAFFKEQQYPTRSQKEDLRQELGFQNRKTVDEWFRKHRHIEKMKKKSAISQDQEGSGSQEDPDQDQTSTTIASPYSPADSAPAVLYQETEMPLEDSAMHMSFRPLINGNPAIVHNHTTFPENNPRARSAETATQLQSSQSISTWPASPAWPSWPDDQWTFVANMYGGNPSRFGFH